MVRSMKISPKPAILLPLVTLTYAAWGAQAEECRVPPYGASMAAYNVFIAEVHNQESAQILGKICRMKYQAADRTELYSAGFTPDDIEHSSTVMLATEYLGIMKYVA